MQMIQMLKWKYLMMENQMTDLLDRILAIQIHKAGIPLVNDKAFSVLTRIAPTLQTGNSHLNGCFWYKNTFLEALKCNTTHQYTVLGVFWCGFAKKVDIINILQG